VNLRRILHVGAAIVRPLSVLLGVKGKKADAAATIIEKADQEIPPEKK
jgi:hypothetical protein